MLHWLFDISLVIGTAAILFDPHSHACPNCGAIWRHIGLGRGRSVKAHTCPGCGQMRWERLTKKRSRIRSASAVKP